jgi:hypothetical protein
VASNDAPFQALAEALRAASAASKPTSTPAPAAGSDNPFAAVVAALAAAALNPDTPEQPRKGGKKKKAAPPESPLSKAMYSVGHGVGYGVAFPTYLVLGMLPDNSLFRGFEDGVQAAKDTVQRMKKRPAR